MAITSTTSAPLNTIIDRPPQVIGVFVNSSGWSQLFRNHLSATGLGDAALGFRISTGADQLDPIGWASIDSISMRFSENVNVQLLALQLMSVNPITVSAPSTTANVTTWTVSPFGPNKIRAILDDSLVTAGGQILDGEWIDSSAVMPSGNGVAGGDFSFRINTLPGDGTGDATVSITDVVNTSSRTASGATITTPGNTTGNYSIFFDINGDGGVTVTDVTNTVSRLQNVLPVTEPGGTAGSGWIADATPTAPRPAASPGTVGVTMTAMLLTDVDGDGAADPGDTLHYTIVAQNTSGATVTGLQLASTVDPNTTLVAASVRSSPLLRDDADVGSFNYLENAPAAAVAPNLEVADPDGLIATSCYRPSERRYCRP